MTLPKSSKHALQLRKITGKLKENVIWQALTKPQDFVPSTPTIDSRIFQTNCASNSSYEKNLISSQQTNNFCISQHSNNGAYHSQRSYKTPVSSHAYVNQHPPNPAPFNFNQSVVKLFRCQPEYCFICGSIELLKEIVIGLISVANQ